MLTQMVNICSNFIEIPQLRTEILPDAEQGVNEQWRHDNELRFSMITVDYNDYRLQRDLSAIAELLVNDYSRLQCRIEYVTVIHRCFRAAWNASAH